LARIFKNRGKEGIGRKGQKGGEGESVEWRMENSELICSGVAERIEEARAFTTRQTKRKPFIDNGLYYHAKKFVKLFDLYKCDL